MQSSHITTTVTTGILSDAYEDDDYKYYQTLNLPCIKRGFMGLHCNYGAPLKNVDV